MTWLVLSWALTFGYTLADTTPTALGDHLAYLEAHDRAASVGLRIQAEADGALRLWVASQVFGGFNPAPGVLDPYAASYEAGLAMHTDSIEVGVRYRGERQVIVGDAYAPTWRQGRLEAYIEFTGRTK